MGTVALRRIFVVASIVLVIYGNKILSLATMASRLYYIFVDQMADKIKPRQALMLDHIPTYFYKLGYTSYTGF